MEVLKQMGFSLYKMERMYIAVQVHQNLSFSADLALFIYKKKRKKRKTLC